MNTRVFKAVRSTLTDAVRTSLDLFKIMVPVIIVVKILLEFGVIDYLAVPLAPFMEMVGLPAKTGLIWAAAIANSIYAAIMVYVALIPDLPTLSVAQITSLSTMMLIAHSLPLEARIIQKCGPSLWGQVFLRLFSALVCGAIIHLVCSRWGLLSEPAELIFRVENRETTLIEWVWGEIRKLGIIFVIILVMVSLLRILGHLKITDLFIRILRPVLRLIGIGMEAATITIIGLIMGIGLGGGLIIQEARSGRLSKKDIFASASLMGLSHGLIDDTLAVMLLGPSVFGVLWLRLAYTLLVVALLTRLWPILWDRHRPGSKDVLVR